MKSLSETKWSARVGPTEALYTEYKEIETSLSEMSSNKSQTETVRYEAHF